jgi:hypothetical protein
MVKRENNQVKGMLKRWSCRFLLYKKRNTGPCHGLPARRSGCHLRWGHVGLVVDRWRKCPPSISGSLANSHSSICYIFIKHWRYIFSSVFKKQTETRACFGQSYKPLDILDEQTRFGRWDVTILKVDYNICNCLTIISLLRQVSTLKSCLIVKVAK